MVEAVLFAFACIAIRWMVRKGERVLPESVRTVAELVPDFQWASVLGSTILAMSILAVGLLWAAERRSGAAHFHRLDAPQELFESAALSYILFGLLCGSFVAGNVIALCARGGWKRCVLRAVVLSSLITGNALLAQAGAPIGLEIAILALLVGALLAVVWNGAVSRLVVVMCLLAALHLDLRVMLVLDRGWRPPVTKCGDSHCNYCS